jgi:hypothetical protein
MGFVFRPFVKIVKAVGKGVKNLVTGAVDAVVNVVDWAVDTIIEPVVKGIGNVIQYVADNPIEAIAKVALTLTGQAWAIPLLDGALVVAKGGDIGDAVKAAAISYAGGKLGATAGQFASAEVVKATGSAVVGQIVGAGTKSAVTALVYGQDPLKAFATGGIQAAMGAALGMVDEKMDGSFEKLQDGAKDTIFAGLAAELEGGNLSETQLGGIISKYTGVGDFMDKFLTTNVGLSGAQAAVVTSAVMSSVSTALAGNPELSGEAFFREFSKAGAEELKALIDKPVNNAIDRVSGAHNSAQAKAKLLNDATNNAATAAEKYNGVQATIASRIAEQDRLRGVYNQKLAAFNTNKSEAGAAQVNAASAAYNNYANKLKTDYNNTYKPQLDGHQAEFNKWNTQLPTLETAYEGAMAYIVTKTEDLNTELKPVMSAADKAVALTLSPTFDEAAYRKANGLSATTDVYSHYLSQGQNLPTSKAAIDATLSYAQQLAMEQSLAAKGIDPFSLDGAQYDAVLAYTAKNLTSINAITGTDFDAFADKLIDVAKNTSSGPVTDYKKAADVKPTDIANGNARLTAVDGEMKWVLASKIAEAFGGTVVGTKLVAAKPGDNPNAFRMTIYGNLQPDTVTANLVPDFKPGKTLSSMVTDARDNNSFSATLTKNIVTLGDEAGRLLDTYVNEPIYDSVAKLYDYYLKDTTAEAAVQNTASIVVGATGEILQAVAGLSVLAGANPNNAVGKFAKNLISLSGDLKTEEWKAAAKEMQDNSAAYDEEWRAANPGEEPSTAMKGFLKAQAIWGNIQDHPVQWLSENVASEILQELPILLISGGTGNVAKRLLLEAGEAQAKKIAARVAVGTGITLDAAEAFGGTAAGAFDEAYSVARGSGMSDQAATDYAMNVAQKAGTIAVMTMAATAGIGGQALSKSLFGDKGSSNFVNAYDLIKDRVKEGAQVTVKEGVTEGIEEGLPQLYVGTSLAQIDPSYDVAGSVFEAAIMGSLAGAGTAGGIYTGDALASALLRVNSGVQKAVANSADPAAATQALKGLGISDNEVLNNLLNTTYDAQYVTTTEAGDMFAKENPGFTPTESEVASFVGKKDNSALAAAVASYVDPRFLDADEVKAAAAAEGITLTDEQATAYVGQKDEAGAVADITAEYDPQGTTRGEAEQFFAELGFTPSEDQLTSFVGPTAEADQQTAIGAYVDPRQTTEAEARKFFADRGYNPTDEEVAERVGQGDAGFAADAEADVAAYIDPRQVTTEEVADAYAALGLQRPTEADINALVGQYMETDLAGKAESNLPTARYNSILDILDNLAGEAGVSDEVQAALDLVKSDMIDAMGDLGLEVAAIDRAVTGIKEAVDALPVGASPEDVSAAINEAISGLENLSAETVNTAITTALEGMNNLSTGDVQGIVDAATGTLGEQITALETDLTTLIEQNDGDVDAALQQLAANLGTTEESLLAEIGSTREELATQFSEGLSALETDLTTLIEQNDGDVDAALQQLAANLGTTEESLLAEIGSTREELTTQFSEGLSALETNLTTLIEQNDGDVDAALQQLAANLGTTEESLLAEIGSTREELAASIGAVGSDVSELSDVVGAPAVADDPNTAANEATDPTGLFATMQMYEDAGLSRDEALNAAIGDVSTALGIARSDLLAAVEETESTLSGQISDVESTLGSQISDVEASLGADIQTVADFVGKPARNVTQEDIDFVIDLIAQGNISQELTSQYDVTGDGLIDINDQSTLESYLQGDPDVALDPNSMFNPATGLYLQQEQDTQATQDLNTELNTQTNANIDTQTQNILAQMQRGQREANIKDMYGRIENSGDAYGQRVDVKTPEKMNINYLYDFNSIFANPSQEGLFASPYGGSTRGRGQPGNGAPSLTPQFSAGGQVEDETDMLLRLLGDM